MINAEIDKMLQDEENRLEEILSDKLIKLRQLIANDAIAVSYQSLGQYRDMLLNKIDLECTLPPVSQQRELLLAFERWKVEKGNYPEYRTKEQMINDYLSQ
jgi:hypothetical protein